MYFLINPFDSGLNPSLESPIASVNTLGLSQSTAAGDRSYNLRLDWRGADPRWCWRLKWGGIFRWPLGMQHVERQGRGRCRIHKRFFLWCSAAGVLPSIIGDNKRRLLAVG